MLYIWILFLNLTYIYISKTVVPKLSDRVYLFYVFSPYKFIIDLSWNIPKNVNQTIISLTYRLKFSICLTTNDLQTDIFICNFSFHNYKCKTMYNIISPILESLCIIVKYITYIYHGIYNRVKWVDFQRKFETIASVIFKNLSAEKYSWHRFIVFFSPGLSQLNNYIRG